MRHKNKTRMTIRRNPPTPAMTAIISSLLKGLLDLASGPWGFHGTTKKKTYSFRKFHVSCMLSCSMLCHGIGNEQ